MGRRGPTKYPFLHFFAQIGVSVTASLKPERSNTTGRKYLSGRAVRISGDGRQEGRHVAERRVMGGVGHDRIRARCCGRKLRHGVHQQRPHVHEAGPLRRQFLRPPRVPNCRLASERMGSCWPLLTPLFRSLPTSTGATKKGGDKWSKGDRLFID